MQVKWQTFDKTENKRQMYGSQSAWLPYICLLFSGFSNVCHFTCIWPRALKLEQKYEVCKGMWAVFYCAFQVLIRWAPIAWLLLWVSFRNVSSPNCHMVSTHAVVWARVCKKIGFNNFNNKVPDFLAYFLCQLTDWSGPVVEHSERVGHDTMDLSLAAFPQVTAKVGYATAVTESSQRTVEEHREQAAFPTLLWIKEISELT